LKEYTNYQLLQLANFFENLVTSDSSGYTHYMLPTLSNDRLIIAKLITIEEAISRFELLSDILSLSKVSAPGIEYDRFKYLTGITIPEQYSDTKLQDAIGLVDYVLPLGGSMTKFKEALDSNLDKIFNILSKTSNNITPSIVICTNIGSHKELIKNNTYRIEHISKNNRIVTIKDHWNKHVKTRHFKIVA
jgi:alpha-amylase/alpha-mannosidase (GH57 family)